eukprot:14283720-Alexandrium_andersonii.AAC.1
MSASLVGSEMCIRDRTSCQSNSSLLHAQPMISAQRALAPDLLALKGCLLYTSDAADDMQV